MFVCFGGQANSQKMGPNACSATPPILKTVNTISRLVCHPMAIDTRANGDAIWSNTWLKSMESITSRKPKQSQASGNVPSTSKHGLVDSALQHS